MLVSSFCSTLYQLLKKKIGLLTATSIVIANMIGTGVFTSVGFQLSSVQNTWSILLLWIAGGLFSLFGAFAYAELGTHFNNRAAIIFTCPACFTPCLATCRPGLA